MTDREPKELKLIHTLSTIFFGAFCGTIALWLFIAIFYGGPSDDLFLINAHGDYIDYKSTVIDQLSANQKADLDVLLKHGVIQTHDGLLSSLLQFYGHVITILIGIFAVLGTIAYMHIKAVSKSSAEHFVESEIEKQLDYGKGSKQIKEGIKEQTKEITADLRSSLEDIDKVFPTLEKMKDDIKELQEFVYSEITNDKEVKKSKPEKEGNTGGGNKKTKKNE